MSVPGIQQSPSARRSSLNSMNARPRSKKRTAGDVAGSINGSDPAGHRSNKKQKSGSHDLIQGPKNGTGTNGDQEIEVMKVEANIETERTSDNLDKSKKRRKETARVVQRPITSTGATVENGAGFTTIESINAEAMKNSGRAKKRKKAKEAGKMPEQELDTATNGLVASTWSQSASEDGSTPRVTSRADMEKRKEFRAKVLSDMWKTDKEQQTDVEVLTPVSLEPKHGSDTVRVTASLRNGNRDQGKSKKKKNKHSQGPKNSSTAAASMQLDSSHIEAPQLSEALPSAPPHPYQTNEELAAVPQSEVDMYLTTNHITIADALGAEPLRPLWKFSYLPENARESHFALSTFKHPTPIQSAAWPYIFRNRDVIGIAETGSGKTLAFGLPCALRLASNAPTSGNSNSPAQAAIVSPTRELAEQIYQQLLPMCQRYDITPVCIYGGVPKHLQRPTLQRAQLIVATPGRLNDFVSEGSCSLTNVSFLVLDEADRMLDKGFEQDIRRITAACLPITQDRQTLMFTATWPASVRRLAESFMRNPVRITVGDNPSGELRANARIEQRVEVLDTNPKSKETRLLQLIREFHAHCRNKNEQDKDRILVFALYKKEASRIESFLRYKGLSVGAIHGDLSQPVRTAALEGFRRGTTPVLVATDVAARGLDIPAVKAVINVTFPLTVEDYVHRIGRTGRAGADGVAVTLFTPHDKANSGALINVLKRAGQAVPEELFRLGTTVKRKEHEAYGAFFKEAAQGVKATKVRFDG